MAFIPYSRRSALARQAGLLRSSLLRESAIGCTNTFVLTRARMSALRPFALGSTECETDLFLVDGTGDWCNSLRPPAVDAGTTRVRVRVKPLDDFVAEAKLTSVDFVKLDVEGAELDAIKGAAKLLTSKGRPVLMVEVYDSRTEPWGYQACEIVQHLAALGYEWFQLDVGGRLESIATDRPTYDANLIAIPAERPLALPNRPKSTAHDREKEVELVC